MKKYLITGIAALAMCIGFTSCSHDLTPVSQEDVNAVNAKQIVDSYNNAFIAKFGQPAANQDWGFGNNAATRAFTRAGGKYATKGDLKPKNVTFPDDCDASKFNPDLTNVLSYDAYCKTLGNANWTPDEFGCGEVYIDKVQKIHIWGEYGKRAKLYLKAGTYDFTNETFDLCADADLYLLSGATLTLNNTAASTAKFDVYIAEGAQLIAKGQDGYRADVDAQTRGLLSGIAAAAVIGEERREPFQADQHGVPLPVPGAAGHAAHHRGDVGQTAHGLRLPQAVLQLREPRFGSGPLEPDRPDHPGLLPARGLTADPAVDLLAGAVLQLHLPSAPLPEQLSNIFRSVVHRRLPHRPRVPPSGPAPAFRKPA